MEAKKISHQKIAIRSLLVTLAMAVIIFIINSWSNIKLTLDGNTPPFKDWMLYITKPSTLISLLIMGVFFYYQNWKREKEAVENELKVNEKHRAWIEEAENKL